MKTFVITIWLIWQLAGVLCAAPGNLALLNLPVPHLTAEQAVAIAQRDMGKGFLLVGVDWCKSSIFEPKYFGPDWSPGRDHPNDFSWFVTFLYKDKGLETLPGQANLHFNSVDVIRIKDDGQIGTFIGVQ